nr:MAG: replication associated protein [Arizlama virus]
MFLYICNEVNKMGSRSWCYTLNNYTVTEQLSAEELECRYHVFGLEVGEQGTPHMQGYIEFEGPKRLAGVKKLIPRAHWETRRGTRDQARDYCIKDGEFLEFGEWKSGGQGARTDLHTVMDMVKEDKPRLDIMEAEPMIYSRNMRFVEAYKAELEKKKTKCFRHVDVCVLWGDANTNKTRRVWEYDPNVFTVNPDDPNPFDGYDGEKTILIDDFYGNGIRYGTFLRLLDGYQFRVNVKYGHRYARWEKIFITSNKPPAEWYSYGLTPALERRLTSIEQCVVTTSCNEEAGKTGAASEKIIKNEVDLSVLDNKTGEEIVDILTTDNDNILDDCDLERDGFREPSAGEPYDIDEARHWRESGLNWYGWMSSATRRYKNVKARKIRWTR